MLREEGEIGRHPMVVEERAAAKTLSNGAMRRLLCGAAQPAEQRPVRWWRAWRHLSRRNRAEMEAKCIRKRQWVGERKR